MYDSARVQDRVLEPMGPRPKAWTKVNCSKKEGILKLAYGGLQEHNPEGLVIRQLCSILAQYEQKDEGRSLFGELRRRQGLLLAKRPRSFALKFRSA